MRVPEGLAIAPIVLSHSGLGAQIIPDPHVPGGFLLSVDGVAQSQVTPDRPEQLHFEYIRRIGHLIDTFRPPGQAISALHLGAGALTLPRYIAHTRPGSRSQVIEWEPDLVDYVRKYLPWDKRWSIRLRYGDAREVSQRLPAGLRGHVDLVVVDVFSGNHTPSHLTTREFFSLLIDFVGPSGVLAINLVDGRGGSFARAQAASLRSLGGFVGVWGEAGVVRGRRFGNIVMAWTQETDEPAWWSEVVRLGPHPTASLEGSKLSRFIAGTPPQLDAHPVASPTLTRTFLDTSG